MPKKLFAIIYILFALLVIASFLVIYLKPVKQHILKDVKVSLKWLNQAQFAGLYYAQDQGIYKELGLNVKFIEYDSKISPIDYLINGDADFALMSSDEFLEHVDQGNDIVAVAAFYKTSPLALVSLAESKIEGPVDFQDKVLGTKGEKVEEELSYLLLLESAGLSKDDVKIKKVGFDSREVDDIKNKTVDVIDVYRTDQLYFFEKENVPFNIIYPERYGANIYNDILVTRRDVIEKNPMLVRSFVKASVAGWQEAFQNKEKAIEITLKYVDSPVYADYEYQKYILNNSEKLIWPTRDSKIGAMNFKEWSKLFFALKGAGFIKGEFELSNFYTNEFLR